jgi:excinuclease UvrABC nuclease subunit
MTVSEKKDKKRVKDISPFLKPEEQGLPVEELLEVLKGRMAEAAAELRYEDAAAIRDTIKHIKSLL